MMFTLSEIIKARVHVFYGCTIQSNRNILHVLCIILDTVYQNLASLETLRSPLEFNIKFCVFIQSLDAEHEFVLTEPPMGQWG